MIHRQAKLSAEELQNLAKLESSAQHWSIQACNLTMQQKQAQAQFEAITTARNQLLSKAYKEAGVDENTIQDIRISMNKETKEGLVDIVCLPNPMAPPANGAPPPSAPPETAPAAEKPTGT
jgi:hypothetical protein